MGRAVLDASVALSWVLPGEDSAMTLPLRDWAVKDPGLELLVTSFFHYELANALWVAWRRGKMTRSSAQEALKALLAFDLSLWASDLESCFDLSCEHGLAVYDAAYLAVALEKEASVWTLDRSLARVAAALGITAYP
ncbi:MAG: type II toxin-antitoxin system VapC family toxin [Bacillota bacterium]